jgi:hypothetical protein
MTPVDWHPTDDDLTLHAYGENVADERTAVNRHLAECAACARIWREIDALRHLTDAADVPEPPADFEAAVWARLAPALPAPSLGRWTPPKVVLVTAWAASIGAIVVAGHMAVTRVAAPPPSATATATATTPAAGAESLRQRVLLTALDDHLSQTEMLFVELMNAPDHETSARAFERATADDLLRSGRLYRATAAETGDRRLTDVLDQVQTILTEVAHGSDAPDPADLTTIRARIDHDDLLFKVRAVTNDIRDRQHTAVTPREGAL